MKRKRSIKDDKIMNENPMTRITDLKLGLRSSYFPSRFALYTCNLIILVFLTLTLANLSGLTLALCLLPILVVCLVAIEHIVDRLSSAPSKLSAYLRNRKLWYFIIWSVGLSLVFLLTYQEPWQYYKEVVSKQAFEHAPYPLWCDNDGVVFFDPDSERPHLIRMSVSGDDSGEVKEFPIPLTSTAASSPQDPTSTPLAVSIASDHQRIAAIVGNSHRQLIIWDIDRPDMPLIWEMNPIQAKKPTIVPDSAQINAIEWMTKTRLSILYTKSGSPNKRLGIAILELASDYLAKLSASIPTHSGGEQEPSSHQPPSMPLIQVFAQNQDILPQLPKPIRLPEGSDITWTKCAQESTEDRLLCAFLVTDRGKNQSMEYLSECTLNPSGVHPLKAITSIRLPDPEDARGAWTTDGTTLYFENSSQKEISEYGQSSCYDKMGYRVLSNLFGNPKPTRSNVDIFSQLLPLASGQSIPIVTNADDVRYPILPQHNPTSDLPQPFIVFTCKMQKHGYNMWVKKLDGSQHSHQLTAHLDAVHCPAAYWSKDRLCIGVCTRDPKDLHGHIKYRMRAIYVDKDTLGFFSASRAPSGKEPANTEL